MAKPKGHRGSWFASWGGETYPCVHKFWTNGIWPHHRDPNVVNSPQYIDLINAIEAGKTVILTEDEAIDGGLGFNRKGYIGLYRVANIEVRGPELHFDFVERLEDFS